MFKRTRDIKVSPIKQIELAAARIPGSVSLAQGIPSFDTPQPIKDFAKQKIDEGKCAKYSLTIGLPELLESVSESLAEEGMIYDPWTEIIATCGSIQAITASIMALTNPGDEVLIPSPTYTSYQEAIKVAGCKPGFFPLNEEKNFDLDVDSLSKYITKKTKIIFYCNPNNPTGTIYSKEQQLKLAEFAEKNDLYILTDEVYKDFIYTDEPYFTLAQIPELRKRVIRIFSFSKAYAMTGWRIGFVHSDASLISEILKIHDSMVTCAPVVSQYAGIAALEYAQDYIEDFRKEFLFRRNRTIDLLDQLPHVFDYQKPNSSYFVFPRVKDTIKYANDSWKLAYDILEKAKVAFVPGVAFGPTGESHLRISFGYSRDAIETSFERLNQYFDPAGKQIQMKKKVLTKKSKPVWLKSLGTSFLRMCAKLYLFRTNSEILAIVGSTGKTAFKRKIENLLEKNYKARSNPKSFNTEIGTILSVLDLEWNAEKSKILLFLKAFLRIFTLAKQEYLILELGVSETGDMQDHLKLIKPTKIVLTNIEPSFTSDSEYLQIMDEEIGYLLKKYKSVPVISNEKDDRLNKILGKNLKKQVLGKKQASEDLAESLIKLCEKEWKF